MYDIIDSLCIYASLPLQFNSLSYYNLEINIENIRNTV
jgi:hypothetical protein